MKPHNSFSEYLRSLDINESTAGRLLTETLGYARSIWDIDSIVLHFRKYLQPQNKTEILGAIARRQDNDNTLIKNIKEELQ